MSFALNGTHIEGGTFNNVAGNVTQVFNSRIGSIRAVRPSGIDILYRSVVIEALHDSGERFPEPACHPGTGTRVLEMLRAWSVDSSPESTILWLYGAAGMHCADVCWRPPQPGPPWRIVLLQAWAFQARNVGWPVRNSRIPAGNLGFGTALPDSTGETPLAPFPNTPKLRFIPVIVIDGLDECKDHKIQQQIVSLFVTAIRDHCLPVRLLITSRPEPHILETLEPQDISAICRHSELCADDSAYADIMIYLCDEFSRIYHEFLARGIDLGRSWPAREAVMHLVKKSSGIFIYAATVIRFIGDEYTHPAERLTAVLRLDPRSTAPLDDLYTEILSVVSPDATRLRVLHAIWQVPADLYFIWLPQRSASFARVIRRLSRRSTTVRALIRGTFTRETATRILARATFTHFDFYRNIVGGLPMLLSRFAPTETSIGLLRNKQVQKAMFFHFADSKSWPKRDSGYPRDLIRLWEDHRFIVELVDCPPTTYQTSPTYKFDGLYREILCRNADLLFLLRSKIKKPYDLIEVVFLLGPHYDPEVFRPLLKLRELVKLPLKPGDSPIDFLKEPDRAGDLYLPQQNIAEDLVLLWILNARTRLEERTWISRPRTPTFYWLDLLAECRPSPKIAHELKSLDLAQICHPRNISPADHHHEVHLRMFSNPKPAQAVLAPGEF
ncbi:hypothetical protein B0H16DRAFT_1701543 [Mycena metata]|uniref:Nephrocystin 3-like N-terminal domain-containing protein n=1 Tax=Mycena metata TaxID=1033252 RepID=A0AAD7MFZ5_9AGAR|nr:hypothetical protein B0H16DRAFT_1701543 [Mycena metata]